LLLVKKSSTEFVGALPTATRFQEKMTHYQKQIAPEFRNCQILADLFNSDAAREVFANDGCRAIHH
jgi:hypothetical protein